MFRYIIALLGVFLVGWIIHPSPAEAQMVCGDRAAALFHLEKGFSETPTAMGLASNGSVIEVLTSESGTFTIITTQPNGVSCLVAYGDSWEDLPARLAGAKS